MGAVGDAANEMIIEIKRQGALLRTACPIIKNSSIC
jgi:hypothetical protein